MSNGSEPGGRAREIFERAIELEGLERVRYVEACCGSDADLEREVRSLLGWFASSDGFLEAPPVPAPERTHELDAPGLAAGSRLGPYRLLEVVGRGGMGVVYRAQQDEPLRREVAIKVLRRDLVGDEALLRFDAECQALARMRHPGVASVLDRGTTPAGSPYLVMELVAGEPITTYRERRELSLERTLELFALVCDAVQHAHQKGVIHRDIKASNVLVEGEEEAARPRILDFGVAKGIDGALHGEEEVTRAGEVLGTPEYMSPEQLGRGAGDVDTRTDVYALGVLLYRLAVGELPFESGRLRKAPLVELQRLVCEVDPPRPSARRPSLPQDLDWIVLRCLEKDRERRYASASDLGADVRRLLACEPVLATRATTRYRVGKFVRRNRALVTAAGAALLVLVGGLALSAWQARRALAAEHLAQERLRSIEQAQIDLRAERDRALSAEAEARRAAIVSDEVSAFVLDLLGSPDRDLDGELVPAASDVRVADVLDAAAAELEGRFAEHPLVEAEVRTRLGTTELNLGRVERARTQYERAYELYRSNLGEGAEETFDALVRLAILEGRLERYERSLDIARRGLELYDRTGTGGESGRLGLLTCVAQALVGSGRYEEAEQAFLESIDGWTCLAGPRELDTLDARTGLGALYWRMGRFEQVEPLLLAVLDDYEATGLADHPRANGVRNTLGLVLQGQKRFSEAERIFAELIARARDGSEAERQELLLDKNNFAQVLLETGRFSEAEPVFEEIVDGVTGSGRAAALSGLGFARAAQGRAEEAVVSYRQALAEIDAQDLADPPLRITIAYNLARTEMSIGRLEEAEVLLDDAAALGQECLEREHPLMPRVFAYLGRVRARLGREDAAPPLREAAERKALILGEGHAVALAARVDLAECLLEAHRPDEAAGELERALEVARAALAPEDPVLARIQAALARSLGATSVPAVPR